MTDAVRFTLALLAAVTGCTGYAIELIDHRNLFGLALITTSIALLIFWVILRLLSGGDS
jgi:hypothetical protein